MGLTLGNVNEKTRNSALLESKEVLAVRAPEKLTEEETSRIKVDVFIVDRYGKRLAKANWEPKLSTLRVNANQLYWRVNVGPGAWKSGLYQVIFAKGGSVILSIPVDIRPEFYGSNDY